MSAQNNQRMNAPTMPKGTEVASYGTYVEASDAVDYLSDNGFDVKVITIVGTDLHMVERVTGRLTASKVAWSGAGSGALWGGFIGLMMSFVPESGSQWILFGLVGGALVGVLMSVLLYAMAGGRRDFTSHSQVVASRYAVLATEQLEEAFNLLQKTPGNQMRPRPRRVREEPTGPTEWGSRPDEKPRFGVRLETGEQPEGNGQVAGVERATGDSQNAGDSSENPSGVPGDEGDTRQR